jgi:hypothetical protein
MTAISNTPTNQNFLSPLNFKFILKRAPHVNFFVQKISVPSINLPSTYAPNPLLRIPQYGDHLEFEELSVSFRVDEDLQNYMELQNWLRAVGKQSYKLHSDLSSNPTISGESLRSEISLTILSSAKRPNYEIVFEDAFPIKISGMSFDSSLDDVSYMEAEATFHYTKYEVTKITS